MLIVLIVEGKLLGEGLRGEGFFMAVATILNVTLYPGMSLLKKSVRIVRDQWLKGKTKREY